MRTILYQILSRAPVRRKAGTTSEHEGHKKAYGPGDNNDDEAGGDDVERRASGYNEEAAAEEHDAQFDKPVRKRR